MAKQAIALTGYYQKSHPFIYDKNIYENKINTTQLLLKSTLLVPCFSDAITKMSSLKNKQRCVAKVSFCL